ncbi:hypothetical protein [Sphingobium cupriresistens]|uniref:hypothetical protein n=1 Tax=Sphingobium cupriresistens TaxID=1132417 RepID=UPI0013ECD5D1|nr:hypothetical protein [Sphingobium cupriresistens]
MGKAFDWLARGFGSAIHDVRQQVLENPWFGRVVTPRSQTITLGTDRSMGDEKSIGERLGWGRPQEHGHAQEQAHGHDMER